MLILSSQHFAILLFLEGLFSSSFHRKQLQPIGFKKVFFKCSFCFRTLLALFGCCTWLGRNGAGIKRQNQLVLSQPDKGKFIFPFFPQRSVYGIVQGAFCWSCQKGAEDGKIVTKKSKLKLHISLLDGFNLTF